MHIQAFEREERRHSERHHLSLDITLRAPGGFSKVATLQSFSAKGCTITGTKLDEVGARYWVRLPGLESQLATVSRTDACETQLNFCQPLHPAVARAYAEAHRPQWHLGERAEGRIRQLLDERAEPRQRAPASSQLLVEGEPATVQNFSPSGIEVTTPTRLRRGSVVSVKWGSLAPFPARVVRKHGDRIGLRLPRFSLPVEMAPHNELCTLNSI
jgi:hypothetical protein